MARILRLLLGLAALIVIVAFAIANRTPVDVGFAPLSGSIELPLYGVFLIGLVAGVLVGGVAVWLHGLGRRREAKRLRRKARALENQIEILKDREEKTRAEPYAAPKPLALQAAGH